MRPIDADKYEYPGDLINEPTLALDDIVPHGRWKVRYPLRECQCCGEIYSELGGNGGKPWHYCPNCGAKMDLEE